MKIAIAKPIILAIFILNISANVIFTILKSNTSGLSNPNCCPNPIQLSQLTFCAKSPSNPPTTNPDKININKKKIDLKESIKTLGVTKVNVKLYEGVMGEIKIDVIPE